MSAGKGIRFGQHIKELRIHLCQKSSASKGVRDFIEQHYVNIKKENPRFPILIRECSGIQPKMWARYEHGKESHIPLSSLSSQQVLEAVENLVQKSA
ncbi:hypothetical protein LSH36_3g21017 [Paralvinella palmiformis]|uniref:NADH dehydrogenase [ubiquinone] 1 alpha subcomplex subunit 2 n=1 Tax=Paralvinella palmiformis TaxID=53620 RepID=A0AAD9NKD9_9ANNE|nr:hypothetical protein LSH36_3g21017 [Paralvinella palmiformis]